MSKTAIIILAAGDSSRLGRPKQLLRYKNTTLLGHTIAQLASLPKAEIFVVLGAFRNDIAQQIPSEEVQLINNSTWKKGMGNSLSVAMESIQQDAFDQVLITLCDLPRLEHTFYVSLLDFHIAHKNQITRTAYPKVKGVPVIFSSDYIPDLMELTSDEGAKVVIQKYKNRVSDFSWPEPYFDIDTMESYQELLNRSSP